MAIKVIHRQPLIHNALSLGIFFYAISIFSIAVILVDSITNNIPEAFSNIWLLPVFFCLSYIFLIKVNNKGIALYSLIIQSIYFLRMAVTPLVMWAGDFASIIDPSVYMYSITNALWLMGYENFVVFFFLAYISEKDFIPEPEVIPKERFRPTKKLKLGVIGLCFAILLILVSDPTIGKHVFLFLLDIGNTYYALSSSDTGIGTLSMFVELLGVLFKMVQIILPPLLLYYILKMRGQKTRIRISVLLLIIICLFATEDRIDALLAGLAFLMTMREYLGSRFKKTSLKILGVVCIICFVGLAIKGGALSKEATDSNQKTSATIAAYFSGVPTVATGLEYATNNDQAIFFLQIVPDIISKIPFAAYILKLTMGISIVNSNQMFNDYIGTRLGYGLGQILPTTVVGYEYFGFILAPLFPCLLIALARYYWKRIYIQENIICRNLYFWITISVSLCPVVMSGLLIVGKISWFYISLWFVKSLNK